MPALDLNSVLNNTSDEVERAPLPPKGTFVVQVASLPTQREIISDKGEWDAIEFNLRGVRPTDDVDSDALREYGDTKNIFARFTVMFPRNDQAGIATAQERLERFVIEHLGIKGGSMKEKLNNTVGKQCLATLDYQADRNDPDILRLRVKSTAPVE